MREKLNALEIAIQLSREEHRQGCDQNRRDHEGILERLRSIETKPVIVLGDGLERVCGSILGTSALAVLAWLAWLWAEHHP